MTKTQKGAATKDPSAKKPIPWRKIMGYGGITAVIVLLIVMVVTGTLNTPQGGIPEGSQVIAIGDPLHVEEDIYGPDEVPAGGAHAPIWQNCGYYLQPIEAENAVHSLEHGAVWIAYSPDLPAAQVDILRGLSSSSGKVLVSPVTGLDDPVVATAWGYQLRLDNAEDPRLTQFIVEFARSLSAPEPGGACSGGVGLPS